MSIITRIINIFFENEYPEDIQRKFHLWLSDPSNQDEKDEALSTIWDSIDTRADNATINSLLEVEYKLGIGREERSRKNKLFRISFGRVAAVILLPLLSAFLTYTFVKNSENEVPVLKECFASNGELKTVFLPDSTLVTINSGSVIIYPEKQSGKERYVYLNGEAYFEVTHNPDLPFIVKTDGLEVEVLGTKFNVSAYSDDPNITTSLKEGIVRLNFSNPDLANMVLSPNDRVIYNKLTNEITSSVVSDKYIAAWKEGHLLFTSASIYDVLRSFQHRYGVDVYLNSSKYENDKLTVKFVHGETLEESLQILTKIVPEFRYKLEKNRLYIY